jgi:D-glycero-D-manno-heptose 1,7-bisphosphate phosphatase
MRKAIFIDRDGVINREGKSGYTCNLEDFEILPDVIETLQFLKAKGYMLIVVSNQSGVAKGLYRHEDVEMLHDYLRRTLSRNGVELDEIYYCIHHPDVSKCLCRKPGTLFLEKAMARFGLDREQCFFIGDKIDRDIEAAENAGIKGILIPINSPLKEILHYIG